MAKMGNVRVTETERGREYMGESRSSKFKMWKCSYYTIYESRVESAEYIEG